MVAAKRFQRTGLCAAAALVGGIIRLAAHAASATVTINAATSSAP